jgi:hypothetical protein
MEKLNQSQFLGQSRGEGLVVSFDDLIQFLGLREAERRAGALI